MLVGGLDTNENGHELAHGTSGLWITVWPIVGHCISITEKENIFGSNVKSNA